MMAGRLMQFEFDCAQDTRNALMLRTWRVMGSLSLSLGGLLALLTGSAAALIPVRSRALSSVRSPSVGLGVISLPLRLPRLADLRATTGHLNSQPPHYPHNSPFNAFFNPEYCPLTSTHSDDLLRPPSSGINIPLQIVRRELHHS
jgi:hypothetical protein